eukprot:COSAG02_NODE_7081_length_3194_cov_2.330210_1_plen_61_part_10
MYARRDRDDAAGRRRAAPRRLLARIGVRTTLVRPLVLRWRKMQLGSEHAISSSPIRLRNAK